MNCDVDAGSSKVDTSHSVTTRVYFTVLPRITQTVSHLYTKSWLVQPRGRPLATKRRELSKLPMSIE